jgi:hypothetical protein
MAALVAMSPCAGSRGGSTVTRDWSTPPVRTSAVALRTRSRMSAKMFFVVMLLGDFSAPRA